MKPDERRRAPSAASDADDDRRAEVAGDDRDGHRAGRDHRADRDVELAGDHQQADRERDDAEFAGDVELARGTRRRDRNGLPPKIEKKTKTTTMPMNAPVSGRRTRLPIDGIRGRHGAVAAVAGRGLGLLPLAVMGWSRSSGSAPGDVRARLASNGGAPVCGTPGLRLLERAV